ncbi:MAG TPA: ribosome silencing factor [Phycisphaerae bacterium]|nr:ribosome silencing factor [Phycisphaerae bacterium]
MKKNPTTLEQVIEIARLAADRNAEDVVLLDLHDISPVTDYFVIATGTSDRQICALADEIAREMKTKYNTQVFRSAGMEQGDWVVMDFFDFVVHLFNRDMRHYYDLELIWGEAGRIDWRRAR